MEIELRNLGEDGILVVKSKGIWSAKTIKPTWLKIFEECRRLGFRKVLIDSTESTYSFGLLEIDDVPGMWRSLGIDESYRIAVLVKEDLYKKSGTQLRHLENRSAICGIYRRHFTREDLLMTWLTGSWKGPASALH